MPLFLIPWLAAGGVGIFAYSAGKYTGETIGTYAKYAGIAAAGYLVYKHLKG